MGETAVAILLDVVGPVAFWIVVLWTRSLRYPRVLLAMAIWTAVWVGSVALLPSGPDRVVRVVLAVLVGVAILWPERVALLSVRGPQAEADRIFRRVSPWLRERDPDAGAALTLASRLSRATFPAADAEWLVASALFRRSLLRRASVTASTLTPASVYEHAARSFWRAGLERHLLGPRHSPGLRDEGAALRCFHEEFDSLIPREALVERPLVPLGGWDDEAEQVVEALRDMLLRHPVARDVRDALANAMTDVLAVARGDRSDETLERQRASAEVMVEQWAALAQEET